MNDGFPLVSLGEVLTKSKEQIEIDPHQQYKQVTIKLWGQGVVLRDEAAGVDIAGAKRFVVRPQQFILSRIDARNGAFGLVPDFLDGAVVSNDFPSFTPNPSRVLPAFLGWMSKTRGFVDLCRAASEGTTNRVRLKENLFMTMKIPLPPLPEQRRIVARVEELVARIEKARGLRRQAVEEATALLASCITQALGDTLIDGYLGDVLTAKPRNGWSVRCDNSEDGLPVLSLGAVTGFNYKATEYKRTSESTVTDAHYWLRPGDLLITRSNTPELVGHAAIYNGSPNPCIYPDLMMRLVIDENHANKRFVHYWLMSAPARDYIERNAKGTSPSMKKISQGTVMSIPFPSNLPVYKQHHIVASLDDLQAKVHSLKQRQAETAAELDALLPSVLDAAFKGKL